MASFSLGQKLNLAYSVTPLARDASVAGAAVDTEGYESVCAFGLSGAGTLSEANNFALTFKEGDTTVEANATTIPAARVVQGATIIAANSVVKATITPMKRYVFVGLTRAASADAVVATAVALGDPSETPA
jgi:hypothetical protein